MDYRDYDAARDRDAAHRIWRETGWLEAGKEESMDLLVGAGRALVAEVAGEAECLALTCPGSIRYLEEELPFACVTGVTTSRVARKQGLAKRLTAAAVARDAADGALVEGLGMFEQGYYDRLGFGAGSSEHWLAFDPAQLNVVVRPRPPHRITVDDWEKTHASRLTRRPGHGRCNLTPAAVTRAEMLSRTDAFGLGYENEAGELTHYFWCFGKEAEHGPYHIAWMVWHDGAEFLELIALVKSLGDQVHSVSMREPAGIQIQDLLAEPFRFWRLTQRSKFEQKAEAFAYWQVRVNDVGACLAQTRLATSADVRFNLRLSDPIAATLDEEAPWRGCAGDYIVTLGKSSGAEKGRDAALPTLAATVNAFTRLWLGVRPASGLAVTDDLAGPADLLDELDGALRLPEPKVDWDF